MDRFRIRALAKILNDNILGDEDRAAAIAMLKKKISIYRNGAEKHGNTEAVREMGDLMGRYRTGAHNLAV